MHRSSLRHYVNTVIDVPASRRPGEGRAELWAFSYRLAGDGVSPSMARRSCLLCYVVDAGVPAPWALVSSAPR